MLNPQNMSGLEIIENLKKGNFPEPTMAVTIPMKIVKVEKVCHWVWSGRQHLFCPSHKHLSFSFRGIMGPFDNLNFRGLFFQQF